MARPTAQERKSSWRETAALMITIVVSVFVAGRVYGSDNATLRADLVTHAAKLEENNKNTAELTTAMKELTSVTQRSSTESLQQRQWFIRTLQALTDSLSTGERNRRLREITAEMQRGISKNSTPSFAGSGGASNMPGVNQ